MALFRSPSIFQRTPTLFFRSMILISLELLANALLWIISAIVFKQHSQSGKLLSLALIAWTLGLRHGLDADHISAIDNATRRIASIPRSDSSESRPKMRKPVTVGLFFSLGHSTIVVCVTMAVAISTAVASNLDGVSGVGGVIGAAISGSFLILVALINSFILVKSYRRIQREKKEEFNIDSRKKDLSNFKPDSQASEDQTNSHRFSGILTRIALPLLKLVNRPWHLYPIGVLFGFGFDTASSITLLSVATVATRTNSTEEMVESSNQSAPQVILLALLFTAGMSLVDSLDSVMMIYGYAQKRDGELENWWDWFEKKEKDQVGNLEGKKDLKINDEEKEKDVTLTSEDQVNQLENQEPKLLISTSTFSSLSLLLTLLSILLAFAIGSIVLLGLIGDECSRCSRAADKQEENGNGGLEGKWWLAWRRANDESGKVGAGIVGVFALILLGYVGGRWGLRKWSARRKEK